MKLFLLGMIYKVNKNVAFYINRSNPFAENDTYMSSGVANDQFSRKEEDLKKEEKRSVKKYLL